MLEKFSDFRVIYFDEDHIITHEGLWLTVRERSSKTLLEKFRVSRYRDFWKYFELAQRILRTGFSSYHQDEDSFGCIFDKKIMLEQRDFLVGGVRVPGSRPLVTSYRNGSLLFGEYSSNKARHSMSVYSASREKVLTKLLELKHIRHIHSITHLSHSEFLVATGDLDRECSMLKLDIMTGKFETLGSGDQTWRLVQPVVTNNEVWYCTDSPDSQNFLYKLDLDSGRREKMLELDGPVFYMRQVSNFLIFSTVAEPSKTQKNYCSLNVYQRDNHSLGNLRFCEDLLSPRFFQYSQLLFPEIGCEYSGDEMYFYPRGVVGKRGTFRFSLAQFVER